MHVQIYIRDIACIYNMAKFKQKISQRYLSQTVN